MQDTASRPTDQGGTSPETIRGAFRELHGPRLHGFALMLSLGDRALAARLAAAALSAAGRQTGELRHPERAAAWLRAHVVRAYPPRHAPPPTTERLAGLGDLDVDEAVVAGLAALAPRERAALIASTVERLDRRDVETIVGRDGARLDRLLDRARRRYLATYGATMPPDVAVDGALATRVRSLAARTLQ